MKDKIINLRASEKEIKQINTLAKKAKMTRSDFIRHSIFNKEIVIFNDLKAVNKELKRIGTNLNQLTTRANMGHFQVLNLVESKMELSNINDRLAEICVSKNRDEVPIEYSINECSFETPSNVPEDAAEEIVTVIEAPIHSPIPESEIENPIENLTEQIVPPDRYTPQVQLGQKRNHSIFGDMFSKKGGE